MKKFAASILALLLLLSTVALADTITIDTDTASDDEIQATITLLRSVMAERNVELDTLPQSFTFNNGHYISIDAFTIENGLITMQYSFSHQEDEPNNFDMNDTLYQNGLELEDQYSSADIKSYTRTCLKGGVLQVTKTYVLEDNSPITIYVKPWFSSEKNFVVTFALE